ncbi:rod shape-determining protein MreD [Clostridium pasteurianum]|uniref:Rod shape-determining protein MreD n=1 Tax=Clostridium pasteurianum BC1 TaxID=86416 RepID=R4K949_CLOPA|nr:rod shape-determining protein MreD [Clostridium pasteurianum]AGK97034.1 rod shape-determining protein MreD [Clostridium pasteurianum BC1]
MKKVLILIILIFGLTIVDNAIMPFAAVYGYYPSLLLIFALSYSIINDRWSAMVIGIITGALQDIFFLNTFGINTLLNMLLCVLAGEIGRNLFKEKKLMPVCAIFALTLLKGILIWVILYMLHIQMNVYNAIFVAVYSFFIAIFMYKCIFNLCKKDYMIRNWKF